VVFQSVAWKAQVSGPGDVSLQGLAGSGPGEGKAASWSRGQLRMLSWTPSPERGQRGGPGEVSRRSLHCFSSRRLAGHGAAPLQAWESQAGCLGTQPLCRIPAGGPCGAWFRVAFHGM